MNEEISLEFTSWTNCLSVRFADRFNFKYTYLRSLSTTVPNGVLKDRKTIGSDGRFFVIKWSLKVEITHLGFNTEKKDGGKIVTF